MTHCFAAVSAITSSHPAPGAAYPGSQTGRLILQASASPTEEHINLACPPFLPYPGTTDPPSVATRVLDSVAVVPMQMLSAELLAGRR